MRGLAAPPEIQDVRRDREHQAREHECDGHRDEEFQQSECSGRPLHRVSDTVKATCVREASAVGAIEPGSR
ncbi:hypothetical protein D3C83_150260 [compost metagenome]